MKYISTRGETEPMEFMDAVLTGLAPDGGLLVPESIPDLSNEWPKWATHSFEEICFRVLSHFVTDIPANELKTIIARSYATFRDSKIAPVRTVGPVHILELYHGPTLAFKDVAMQFLANTFEHILNQRKATLNIVGSTSGDTGSAAIHGVRGKKRINIFMMHPKGRTSKVQEMQMTSVLDDNVYNLQVEGTFDDCQRVMKEVFRDTDFKDSHHLGAVNSVNWARVLAQIVYYFTGGIEVMSRTGKKSFRVSVPTGNFGNILAGWYAKQMGLPISKLVLATNENDILARFFSEGDYSRGDVKKTISPSMDIQAASNFERYLYYRLGEKSADVARIMRGFERGEGLDIEFPVSGGSIDAQFAAGTATRAETEATIKEYQEKYNVLLDPHTAVGVFVGEKHLGEDEPMLCLSTAHPAKFPESIQAACGTDATHPVIDKLAGSETRCQPMLADDMTLKRFISDTIYPGENRSVMPLASGPAASTATASVDSTESASGAQASGVGSGAKAAGSGSKALGSGSKAVAVGAGAAAVATASNTATANNTAAANTVATPASNASSSEAGAVPPAPPESAASARSGMRVYQKPGLLGRSWFRFLVLCLLAGLSGLGALVLGMTLAFSRPLPISRSSITNVIEQPELLTADPVRLVWIVIACLVSFIGFLFAIDYFRKHRAHHKRLREQSEGL